MDVFILGMYALLTTTLTVWLYVEYRAAMRGWRQTARQRDRALALLEIADPELPNTGLRRVK